MTLFRRAHLARAARASRLAPLFIAVAVAGSCADSTDPDDSLPPGLNVLRIRDGAPALQSSTVSFYAKRGEDRTGAVYFTNASGGQGSEYVRLEIRAASLVNRPNGTPIAMGDSIRITIRITDQRRIRFTLEPEGLVFNPSAPARLTTHYVEADHDFNADGRIDAADLLIEATLANYRQATSGDPFLRLSSIINLQLDGIASDLPGFSQYAVAY